MPKCFHAIKNSRYLPCYVLSSRYIHYTVRTASKIVQATVHGTAAGGKRIKRWLQSCNIKKLILILDIIEQPYFVADEMGQRTWVSKMLIPQPLLKIMACQKQLTYPHFCQFVFCRFNLIIVYFDYRVE